MAASIMGKLSLFLLTFQTVMHILIMRQARTRPTESLFLSSSAIIISEVVKLVVSAVILLYQEGWRKPIEQTRKDPIDCLKIIVPAVIYIIQNNVIYLAVSNLDAAYFQVIYQVKLLTTAIFSVLMLGRRISLFQWFALFLLFCGVAIVQLQPNGSNDKADTESTNTKIKTTPQNQTVGLLAVVAACLMSGFAGVYFEKILKGSKTSLWLRNVQLALLGIVFGLAGQWYNEGDVIASKGYLFGFDWLVWLLVALQSIGGLIVALVVKYANNILKGFACSAAIVLSCVISVFLFGVDLSSQFMLGATLVVVSILLYGWAAPSSPVEAKKKQ